MVKAAKDYQLALALQAFPLALPAQGCEDNHTKSDTSFVPHNTRTLEQVVLEQ